LEGSEDVKNIGALERMERRIVGKRGMRRKVASKEKRYRLEGKEER
jgi:hypothetical protein